MVNPLHSEMYPTAVWASPYETINGEVMLIPRGLTHITLSYGARPHPVPNRGSGWFLIDLRELPEVWQIVKDEEGCGAVLASLMVGQP